MRARSGPHADPAPPASSSCSPQPPSPSRVRCSLTCHGVGRLARSAVQRARGSERAWGAALGAGESRAVGSGVRAVGGGRRSGSTREERGAVPAVTSSGASPPHSTRNSLATTTTTMPTADDWLLNPLGLVEGLFGEFARSRRPPRGSERCFQCACAQHGPTADWEKMAVSYFANKLQDGSQVPSLNDVPLQQLKSGGVARFRCMVQDMFDPEFYLRVFEVLGPDAQTAPQQQVNLESPRNVTADRQTFYCVPVPGEAAWVKEISFT
ncbi:unnamed protein product [Lampetra planeri]